jgi:hypothetical protein
MAWCWRQLDAWKQGSGRTHPRSLSAQGSKRQVKGHAGDALIIPPSSAKHKKTRPKPGFFYIR